MMEPPSEPDPSEYPACQVCWTQWHIDDWRCVGLGENWLCPWCNSVIDPVTMRKPAGQLTLDFD